MSKNEAKRIYFHERGNNLIALQLVDTDTNGEIPEFSRTEPELLLIGKAHLRSLLKTVLEDEPMPQTNETKEAIENPKVLQALLKIEASSAYYGDLNDELKTISNYIKELESKVR